MKRIIVLLSIVFSLSSALFAQDSKAKFSGWKKTETEHFTFIYEDASREAVEGYIKYADEAYNNVAKIYSIPKDKIDVYVTGRTNTMNAAASAGPIEIFMYTNPFTLTDFPFRDEWQKYVFTHELIHAANFSLEDKDNAAKKIFGPVINNADFNVVNGWALEGLTTVLETELSKGGRGRSPYFEMYYKALTLDNGFISYSDVGKEAEPPYGQAYVIGYLMMRTIADKYGIETLADIERNRKFGQSWEESVKLVTGQSAEDLYRDVRIALAKKYNKERDISEGIFVSPRDLNNNYYKPAVIFDDGTMIALRYKRGEGRAVVKLDPRAKTGTNFIQNTKPEKDLNTVYQETILFSGSFMDTESVTADEKGNIYVIMPYQRADKAPGQTLEGYLYSWTEKDGFKQLVNDTTLFQPSVSRDGSTLVAVEQNGLYLRLVKVDVKTGNRTVILEESSKSFIEPNVNADGSKVTFMSLDGSRARICVMNLDGTSEYEVVANDDETIYDPSYPMWNKDGSLSYTSNNRGRLEIFEAVKDSNNKWISKPVLSDPIGCTWAYKNDMGVYYGSEASSGTVIKIKPLEEWGNPADFEGPSPAGEKICFGDLTSDYPSFNPYAVSAKQDNDSAESNTDGKDKGPVPLKQKEIKHRSQENKEKAESLTDCITELDEKTFIPVPKLFSVMPVLDYVVDLEGKKRIGIGVNANFITPRLQLNPGLISLDAEYYPFINNFTYSASSAIPVNSAVCYFGTDRKIGRVTKFGNPYFSELSSVTAGVSVPFVNTKSNLGTALVEMDLFGGFTYGRYSKSSCSVNGVFEENNFGVNARPGMVFNFTNKLPKYQAIKYGTELWGIGYYDIKTKELLLGTEGSGYLAYSYKDLDFRLKSDARYTPFNDNVMLSNNYIKYGGRKLNYDYETRIVPAFEIGVQESVSGLLNVVSKYYVQTLLSGNKLDFEWDKTMALGMEFNLGNNFSSISYGASLTYDFNKKFSKENLFDDYNIYFGVTKSLGN